MSSTSSIAILNGIFALFALKMIHIGIFVSIGNMFLYLTHLLHLSYVKLFSPSEIILLIMTIFSYILNVFIIFAFLDPNENVVNNVMSIKIVITNFHVLCFEPMCKH